LLVYKIDFNNLPREGAAVQSQGLANLFNLNRLFNNLYYTIFPLNAAAFIIALLLGIGAFVWLRKRGMATLQTGVIGLALFELFTIAWVVNMFSDMAADPGKIRYVLPATAAACIILGAALALVARAIPKRWAYANGAWVALPLVVLVFIPQLTQDWALVQNRRLPDRRVELRQWVDTNLEPGTVIVDRENNTTFNPYYGGIPYKNWVDWKQSDNIMEHSLADWRASEGVSYAVVPQWEADQLNATPEGRDYLASMLHLRDFYRGGERGPKMAFYRLWRMGVETEFHFGESILLAGYDRSAESLKPGDTLTLHFYWDTVSTPADNYSLFIHLVPPDDAQPLAQADGAPAVPERLTLTWDDPTETLISPPFQLAIPADLAPGDYRVMVGLYNFVNGTRLPVTDADSQPLGDSLELMRLKIIS
jgi:hypothetical protein